MNILYVNFNDAKNHNIGKGVYFTDMIDYAWFYAGEKDKKRFLSDIPKVGDSFSLVASEIYYDSNKLEKVYNTDTI